MQLYGENIFFISLAVILVPAFILGYCEKPLKHYGMAATVFFVVMTMKDKPQALCCLRSKIKGRKNSIKKL